MNPNQWGFKKIFVGRSGVFLDDKYELYHVEKHGQPRENCFTMHLPYVHRITTKEEIKEQFELLEWGKIADIDLVKNPTSGNQKGFIHFEMTSVNSEFKAAYNHLWYREDAKLKITYDIGRYWWVFKVDTKMIDLYSRLLIIEFSDSDSDSDSD